MQKRITANIILILIAAVSFSQPDSLATYINPVKHEIVDPGNPEFSDKPKNIILFIGDGMGVAQIYAAMTANGGKLNMNHMQYIGFIDTQSADNFITDSGAGGSAIATGQRVKNGYIAMDSLGQPIPTILQISIENGLAGGLVATSVITHATPAAFIAHQNSRNNAESIAADFLNTEIDFFVGRPGGRSHFEDREDGRNLISELEAKGYRIFNSLQEAEEYETGPMGIFAAHSFDPEKRGTMIVEATSKAINVLKQNEKGFFLMVEGSQIDWAGHRNNTPYLVGEMLDMDIAIGVALEFAAKDGETLVLVTSDHETGGMAITDGDFETQTVTAQYATTRHTAVLVPVLAYGPGAKEFIGFYNNTDLFHKMHKLLELE